eukprot:scaffold133301_cov72-Phaeocystis_antarctica.AAC.2
MERARAASGLPRAVHFHAFAAAQPNSWFVLVQPVPIWVPFEGDCNQSDGTQASASRVRRRFSRTAAHTALGILVGCATCPHRASSAHMPAA